MFTVQFFQFNKRENSTARPEDAALSASCILKDGSSIVDPVIQMDLGLTDAPKFYNYCYIAEFSRYYFVRDWFFDNGLWTASLTADVLASCRYYIGSANLYVLRSSAAYNGYIPDNLYPADAEFSLDTKSAQLGWSYTSGIYVLGIVSKNADFGSLCYYVLTTAQMSQLVTMLLSDGFFEDNEIQTAEGSVSLTKCLVNPIQYIKTCIYIPVPRTDLSTNITTANVVVFNWDTGISAAKINPAAPIYSKIVSDLTITNHPQAATRGKFLNDSPYTERTLYAPPFGAFQLDTAYFIEPQTVNLLLRVDLVTGEATLGVETGAGVLTNQISGMLGVPINLSQVTRDWLGATEAITAGAVGAVLNPGNIASTLVNTIGNVINATRPKCQSISGGGSFAQLTYVAVGAAYLVSRYAHVVDDDNAHQGRPLCESRTLSTIPGFIQVLNGDIAAPFTADELQRVRQYLEGGFYYE